MVSFHRILLVVVCVKGRRKDRKEVEKILHPFKMSGWPFLSQAGEDCSIPRQIYAWHCIVHYNIVQNNNTKKIISEPMRNLTKLCIKFVGVLDKYVTGLRVLEENP